MHKAASLTAAMAALVAGAGCAAPLRPLPRAVFNDKLEGAWIGQMVGVSYGAPCEFRAVGRIDDGEIRAWQPEFIASALEQDDLYVELTWLRCLADHGLDVTPRQAGEAFAATQFPLWHANAAGRENVRAGLWPPASGHPDHNVHANDIDYQIEADVIGILCPGLPREANRLGAVFGHVTNYGDGVYGGLFIQGMYCAAYFESHDVERVIAAGLACLPAESRYARCIRDVLRWHRECPHDWHATWRRLEARYNDGRDCTPGPLSIDAHLNGAYVVMGLLYGGGDFWKVCEIAVRCGQDSDCNPSSAAGVWSCMRGRSGLPPEAWAGLAAIADRPFANTTYSYRRLLDACRAVTERIIVRNGGRLRADAYRIPVQEPRPAPLEQWDSPLHPAAP